MHQEIKRYAIVERISVWKTYIGIRRMPHVTVNLVKFKDFLVCTWHNAENLEFYSSLSAVTYNSAPPCLFIVRFESNLFPR